MSRIALIHALSHSVRPINDAFIRDWPEAGLMNVLDDSLSADLAASGRGLDARMHERFAQLADYALQTGADAILFSCSAFGPCIEAQAARHKTIPILKPNEAMITEAVARAGGGVIGLLATFGPTLASMPPEFPAGTRLQTRLVADALDALNRGDGERHDALIEAAGVQLAAQGCAVIALAQFSMARAAPRLQQRLGTMPVITTVDSAVREIRRRLKSPA